MGRNTQGVRLVNLAARREGELLPDAVAGVTRVVSEDDDGRRRQRRRPVDGGRRAAAPEAAARAPGEPRPWRAAARLVQGFTRRAVRRTPRATPRPHDATSPNPPSAACRTTTACSRRSRPRASGMISSHRLAEREGITSRAGAQGPVVLRFVRPPRARLQRRAPARRDPRDPRARPPLARGAGGRRATSAPRCSRYRGFARPGLRRRRGVRRATPTASAQQLGELVVRARRASCRRSPRTRSRSA